MTAYESLCLYSVAIENSKILIDSREDEEDYIISVKDFGEGISDENKENIFHRFERVGKGEIKGFGLGLAIVKMIVDMHNGRVWVEDNPEGGCIFYVRISKAKQCLILSLHLRAKSFYPDH